MTVVFEVLSPSNTHPEMADKYTFYEEYGVEEYYIYDPEEVTLEAYIRQGTSFRKVRPLAGHVSPLLGIRFDLPEKEEAVEGEETVESPEMIVRYPDGQPFLAFEVVRQAEQELRQENSGLRESLEQAERQAEAESQRAETERERAEAESQRAEAESQRADQAQQRLARISELTARVLSGQATEEERLELNGYLAQSDE